MPRSRAMRRASGDALMRPLVEPSVAGAGSATGFGASSFGFSSAFGLASSAGADTDSPLSPMKPIVLPTSTSPSVTAILSRTPLASASTSCVTLSVSSS